MKLSDDVGYGKRAYPNKHKCKLCGGESRG